MSPPPINPEPIDPLASDAASGSVFTGERKSMSRWTPKWGAGYSPLDIIFLGAIAAVVLVVIALLVL